MIEQLTSFDFMTKISLKFDMLLNYFEGYLSGADNLKVISFVLMMLALILFLFLIIIIYVRNIIYFVKTNNPQKNIEENEHIENKEDEVADLDEQQELEKELQRELDMALAARIASEQKIIEEQEKQRQKELKEEQKAQKKEKKAKEEKAKEDKENIARKKSKSIDVGLDWQKGKIPSFDDKALTNINEINLSYQQSQKDLNQLMGLVVDMLGRGVDDLKIAQTLNFKSQGMTDENEILKAIDAVKEFINLCISGKFTKLKHYDSLPSESDALWHLAKGDTSLALALLENLMDSNIDKATASGSEEKRQRIYSDVSRYACCFGALAEMNDIMLATSAYELAIELHSVNVTAWSRLGDAYKAANSMPKAVWAYQNVLNFADGEIDISQIANANRHISEHLYAEGNSLQAAKLYNSSKQYYDSLGINRRLDKQEIEIIEIIESNQQTSLPEMIQKLLNVNERTSN